MRALISVYDKTDIDKLAKGLVALGFEIISTGGTAKYLREIGLEVIDIASVTNFAEMLDGRVKTLHPKIHGGLLARRDLAEHLQQIEQNQIELIDIVVVNLYPFEKVAKNPESSSDEIIENIDIGGPSMLRSAAKNFASVAVLTDFRDYELVLKELQTNNQQLSLDTKKNLAFKAFFKTAQYDLAIATYLSPNKLRYGENPQQKSSFVGEKIESLQGKALSYNNILDVNTANEILADFKDEPFCVIIKHNNPCGASIGNDLNDAYKFALACDPVSAFGGIVAFNGIVEESLAETLSQTFLELIIAKGFSKEALAVFKNKKNLRLVISEPLNQDWQYRNANNGFLAQTKDYILETEINLAKNVTNKIVSNKKDLSFAWKMCKHIKSNAIAIVKNQRLIGIGAGQTSRIDALKIAIDKAKQHSQELLKGSVLASDAFFPFGDSIIAANKAGITEIIQPGGSVRDQESIDNCNKLDMAMLFTGTRHFKH